MDESTSLKSLEEKNCSRKFVGTLNDLNLEEKHATSVHGQLRNLMVYCEELDSLLYFSSPYIYKLNTGNHEISQLNIDPIMQVRCLDCKHGYLVFAFKTIFIVKVSKLSKEEKYKPKQFCSKTTQELVNSLLIVKKENQIYVVVTYNKGTIHVLPIIEEEEVISERTYQTTENQNFNGISQGTGKYSDYYVIGMDQNFNNKKSIFILSHLIDEGYVPQLKLNLESSCIATKWIPDSSKILLANEFANKDGSVVLFDFETQKILLNEKFANPARTIKSGYPCNPLVIISDDRNCIKIISTVDFTIEPLVLNQHPNSNINGIEFVKNRLYIMIGSFLVYGILGSDPIILLNWVPLEPDLRSKIEELFLILKDKGVDKGVIWRIHYFYCNSLCQK